MRREMKGPNNIDNLLSKLGKSKEQTTNIQIEKDSTISIDDLDTLSVGNSRKSSKRKSDKNIVNIAI